MNEREKLEEELRVIEANMNTLSVEKTNILNSNSLSYEQKRVLLKHLAKTVVFSLQANFEDPRAR